jgi:RNA polymerase sigma-70 factor (ECF subfamily)
MFPSDSESDVIRQATHGDRAALAQLLFDHHDVLQRHIARRLSTSAPGVVLTEDILQQTFVRAAHGIASFQGDLSGFRAWLTTIATNLILDAQKRQRRERRAPPRKDAFATLSDDGSFAHIVDRLAGDITPPVGRVERRESIHRMRTAIANLSPEYREVIQRYYLLDESLEEIATTMGRTKDAIRGLCYRARKDLREIMGGSSLFFSS